MNKILLFILLLSVPVYSQFISAFVKEDKEYQIEYIKKPTVARTKVILLKGDYVSWYALDIWNVDCKKKTFFHKKMEVYNSQDEKVFERVTEKPEVDTVHKGSFGDLAFYVWCSE